MAYPDTTILFNNSINDYLKALIIGILIFLGLKIFKNVVVGYLKKIAKKIPGKYDDFIVNLFEKISPLLYIVASIYYPLQILNVPTDILKIFQWLFSIVLTWEGIKLATLIIKYVAEDYVEKNIDEEKTDLSIIHMGTMLANIVVWAVALLLLLSNLGFDVTALVASLGVGGIAIALAAQNILGDLFSSLTIFFDKPFQIGDFIITGTEMGTVEKIGLKTTRLKTPQGEQLIIPNSDLTTARVQNFKRMQKRRVLFQLGVAYETPTAKVEKIPEMIEKIVTDQEDAEFSRCHFKAYGDSGLMIEGVYFVNTNDYNTFVKIEHAVNISIKKAFEKAKIEFAYPTQTVYLKK